MTNRRYRAGAVAVAACLALATAPAAMAKTVTGDIAGLDPAAVACVEGSLLVELTPDNPFSDATPGRAPSGGVAGYTLTLRAVEGVDLGTAAGWSAARDMTVEDARKRLGGGGAGGAGAAGAGDVRTAVTDAAGKARFGGLPVGLYLLEIAVPGGGAGAGGAGEVEYKKYKPALITVPVGQPGGEVGAGGVKGKPWWDCEPHFFPKAEPVTPGEPDEPGNPDEPGKPDKPTTPTTPEKPGQPGQPSTPGEPSVPVGPSPEEPGTPGGSGSSRPSLANTGVSVLGVVAAGAALIAAGVWLRGRRRD